MGVKQTKIKTTPQIKETVNEEQLSYSNNLVPLKPHEKRIKIRVKKSFKRNIILDEM